MNGNIIEIFLRNAELHPDRAALIEAGRTASYRELRDDMLRVAASLREDGVRQGDPVLIFVPMSIDLYTLLLGIFHLGAVAVFIDAWADRSRLDAACRMLPMRAFVGIPKAHLLRLISREIRRIPIKRFAYIGRWHPRSSTSPEPAHVPPDDAALMTFTTGSTGAPKAARRSHRFLVAQHQALVDGLGASADDTDMPILPIFPLSNLALGATTVIPPVDPRSVESFDPRAVIRTIEDHDVATTSGSPAFYAKLAEYCAAHRITLGLKRVFLGGAPVFPRLAAALAEAFPGVGITIVYGSTEAEPISTITVPEMLRRASRERRGLPVGRPVEFIDLRIMPIAGGAIAPQSAEAFEAMALPAGEIGEICVAGEHVLSEYYGDPAAWRINKIEAGGRLWHRTGDAGYLDQDGELFLAGRVGQSFIHRGERIFVLPVEERLQGSAAITIGTILQIRERLVIALEAAPGKASGIGQEIARLGIGFDDLVVLPALPRDPRHHSKIDYVRLRAMVEAEQRRAAAR